MKQLNTESSAALVSCMSAKREKNKSDTGKLKRLASLNYKFFVSSGFIPPMQLPKKGYERTWKHDKTVQKAGSTLGKDILF